jgi:hypothetical protein
MRKRFSRDERKKQLVRTLRDRGVETTRQLAMRIGMSPNSSSYVGDILNELYCEGWVWCRSGQTNVGIATAIVWGLEPIAQGMEYDGQYLFPF